MTTGWRKKQIMMKQEQQRDPLDVVKIVVEALDDAYAAGVRNSSKRPEWVGLSTDEVFELASGRWTLGQMAVLVEAKLKEKNGHA